MPGMGGFLVAPCTDHMNLTRQQLLGTLLLLIALAMAAWWKYLHWFRP